MKNKTKTLLHKKDGGEETGPKKVPPSLLTESLRQYDVPTSLEARVGLVLVNNGLHSRSKMTEESPSIRK